MDKPILMEFPLRGEWLSPNTPGTKVPSHGTNRLGTRYAYDFIQVDWERPGRPSYRGGLLRYLLFGIPVEDYFCWGQPVYAPCGGTVLLAKDGYPENRRTGFFSDLRRAYQSAHSFDPAHDTIQAVAGNFVIIRYAEDVYAALCHLQTGSIRVSAGQSVRAGEIIGKVGHSGNSLSPHLHFQLMDSVDMAAANGLPCAFKRYERYENGSWKSVVNGIPTAKDRIRYHPDNPS